MTRRVGRWKAVARALAGGSWLIVGAGGAVGAGGVGCVSNPDVKRASTGMTAALQSMSGAEAECKRLYIEEIDATREQLGRALVAAAVHNKLEATAKVYDEGGNLLEVSRQIDATAAAARSLVALLQKTEVPPAPAPGSGQIDPLEKFTDSLFQGLSRQQLDAAANLPEPAATEIRAKAKSADLLRVLNVSRDDVVAMLRLGRLRNYVQSELFVELDQHVAALTVIHSRVDAWIKADVTVSGAQVADTLQSVTGAVDKVGAAANSRGAH